MKHQASAEERVWEILPGALEWATFILLVLLSWLAPFVISYGIMLYSLYWLIKSIHVSFHLIWTYRELQRTKVINWLERLERKDANDGRLPWREVWHLIIIPTYN